MVNQLADLVAQAISKVESEDTVIELQGTETNCYWQLKTVNIADGYYLVLAYWGGEDAKIFNIYDDPELNDGLAQFIRSKLMEEFKILSCTFMPREAE